MNLRCKHVARTGVTVTTISQCDPPAKRDDAESEVRTSSMHDTRVCLRPTGVTVTWESRYLNAIHSQEETSLRCTQVARTMPTASPGSYVDMKSLSQCCSVLQCVAVCCSVLQGVAMCCSVLQWRCQWLHLGVM